MFYTVLYNMVLECKQCGLDSEARLGRLERDAGLPHQVRTTCWKAALKVHCTQAIVSSFSVQQCFDRCSTTQLTYSRLTRNLSFVSFNLGHAEATHAGSLRELMFGDVVDIKDTGASPEYHEAIRSVPWWRLWTGPWTGTTQSKSRLGKF